MGLHIKGSVLWGPKGPKALGGDCDFPPKPPLKRFLSFDGRADGALRPLDRDDGRNEGVVWEREVGLVMVDGLKPYLKWAGGKRQLLPEIRRFVPREFDLYVEPFVGAGAVLFDLQPERAVINDANGQLVLTYEVIRDEVEGLIELLKEHAQRNSREYYYEVRELDRDPVEFGRLSKAEKAARLIFLNKTCFNGLYRVNSQGLFNVPYGRYKNPAICEEETLRGIHRYLNQAEVTILNGDFEEAARLALSSGAKQPFVYFDPPYHSADNSNFTGYQASGFSERDQVRLRDVMKELSENGVKCLLSNSDTEFIRKIYKDEAFRVETVTATRAINSDSAGRGKVNEVLVRSRNVRKRRA